MRERLAMWLARRQGGAVGRGTARRRAVWRGAVLLEVVVALTILAVAGATMIALSSESLDALRRARTAEEETVRASALLHAVALWPREDLDRHLGDRPQGPWRLRVDRPLPMLYVVTLAESTGSRTLLSTTLYRWEVTSAAP